MFEDLTVLFRVRKLLHIYVGTHKHIYIFISSSIFVAQVPNNRLATWRNYLMHFSLSRIFLCCQTDRLHRLENAERIVAFRLGAYFTRNSTADKKATPDIYRRVRTGIPDRFVARSPSGSVLKYLQRNFASESAFSRQQY